MIVNGIDYSAIPFLEAHPDRYLNLSNQPRRPWDLIVVHSMEAPENPKTALNVARWFHEQAEPHTSAHYCGDDTQIIQCVQLRDVAYAAPGANRNGIHLELAGYAAQTAAQWQDPFSLRMLRNMAALCGLVIMPKTKIPLEYVDASGLLQGKRGITTHRQVTLAFHKSDHMDPGANFPMDVFFRKIRDYYRP